MKKTFEELQEVDEIVGRIYAINPELKKGKFGYWYNKFYKKNLAPLVDEVNEKISDEKVRNALVDKETKEILYEDKERRFYKNDRVGLQKNMSFTRDITKEYLTKEIEIVPCISSEVPSELQEEERELLTGLLI